MVYYLVNPRFQEASSACQSESGDLELVKQIYPESHPTLIEIRVSATALCRATGEGKGA